MLKKAFLFIFLSFIASFSYAQEANQAGIITKEERCAIARENLAKLSDLSKPIYQRNEQGQVVELTYAEILQMREESQDLIKRLCSNSIARQPIKKSFYGNAINRAKGAAATRGQTSIDAALRQALLSKNYSEVYTILVYVEGISAKYANEFIKLAKAKTVEQAINLYNTEYKGKKAKDDKNSKSDDKPKEETADEFEKSIKNLPPGERVAKVKEKLAQVAEKNGWKKDSRLTRMNGGRTVYKDTKGNLYAIDTEKGRFEKCNSSGNHQGEYDIDGKFKEGSIDKSGGHDLIVK